MGRRRRASVGQEKRKRENRRPILYMLCAALLRSFRGQHSEKMKGRAQGNWDPREGQQPFRPNPNGVGDRTTTLRRLLIGAVVVLSFLETGSSLLNFDPVREYRQRVLEYQAASTRVPGSEYSSTRCRCTFVLCQHDRST